MLREFAVLTVAAVLMAALPTTAYAGPLSLGDQAPPLNVKFVKGSPISLEEGKGSKVHVVEFWATWCGPCRTSIPHLTELQEKYGDKGLAIIGITDEKMSDVRPFLAQMGGNMDYRVAIDNNRSTAQRYMVPFGQEGIPHAFVVDTKGRLVWHGHPMDPFMEQLIVSLLKDVAPETTKHSSASSGGATAKAEGSHSR